MNRGLGLLLVLLVSGFATLAQAQSDESGASYSDTDMVDSDGSYIVPPEPVSAPDSGFFADMWTGITDTASNVWKSVSGFFDGFFDGEDAPAAVANNAQALTALQAANQTKIDADNAMAALMKSTIDDQDFDKLNAAEFDAVVAADKVAQQTQAPVTTATRAPASTDTGVQ